MVLGKLRNIVIFSVIKTSILYQQCQSVWVIHICFDSHCLNLPLDKSQIALAKGLSVAAIFKCSGSFHHHLANRFSKEKNCWTSNKTVAAKVWRQQILQQRPRLKEFAVRLTRFFCAFVMTQEFSIWKWKQKNKNTLISHPSNPITILNTVWHSKCLADWTREGRLTTH